jgi:hypothetical protein
MGFAKVIDARVKPAHDGPSRSNRLESAVGSVDIHAMARKAAERWMKAQKLVSVLS